MSALFRKRNSAGKILDLFKFMDNMQGILMCFSSFMEPVHLECTKDKQHILCKDSVFLGPGD